MCGFTQRGEVTTRYNAVDCTVPRKSVLLWKDRAGLYRRRGRCCVESMRDNGLVEAEVRLYSRLEEVGLLERRPGQVGKLWDIAATVLLHAQSLPPLLDLGGKDRTKWD